MPTSIRASTRFAITAATWTALTLSCGAVRAEPPIRSPEDAACRVEARAKVFTAPNPRGLELEEIGRQIYGACMRRIAQATAPAERIGELLKPFTRLDTARGQANGAGLGLAIVERVLQRHGAELHLGNREGGGLLIQISLEAA